MLAAFCATLWLQRVSSLQVLERSMGAKRALIVDDSRSARLFLARMLEKYEIDVDSAETAEAAIEYLASHRPDVIFMDHMMPGMDGFQAVQAIKNNPRTATIPIMMYTSQEGELYLGQARALGAVGVLPKQIKPTDVSKVLYQLHLVPDRRTGEQTTFKPVAVAVHDGPTEDQVPAAAAPGPRVLTETSLREQFAELRRALVAGIDTQTDRITAEVRALLLEALPPPPVDAVVHRTPQRPWGWIVASVALAIALASTALWWRDLTVLRSMAKDMEQLRAEVARLASPPAPRVGEVLPPANDDGSTPNGVAPGITAPVAAALPGQPAVLQSTRRAGLTADGKPLVIPVPYGSDALGGARLDTLRQMLDRLTKQGVGGVVDIKTFPGRFCLMGNPTDGYSVAPDETLASKCDLMGNPSDDALSPAQRTPIAFANLAGSVRNASHGNLEVQVASGDPAVTAAPYPQASSELTAGEWNRAAAANNRIEIRLH
jgi:CheY-like chemotaxis protein